MSLISKFITNHILPSYKEEIVNECVSKLKKSLNSFTTQVETMIRGLIQKTSETLKKELTEYIDSQLKNIKQGISIHKIRCREVEREVVGVVHEKFDELLSIVANNIPVYIYGPAGCGKSHMCKQVADALGLKFYFTNAVTQEYRITGFIDARGVYHETEFYKACKNGGLFMLDEIDGSIPEVLILLNAAIANRYFDFPNGRIDLHPDFRIIAAGNTTGIGGDSLYTGRTRLDAASLDRFMLIQIDYSKTIELNISNNNMELVEFVRILRANSNLIVSYRAIYAITLLEKNMSLRELLRSCITKGIPADRIVSIQSNINQTSSNKYIKAFLSL